MDSPTHEGEGAGASPPAPGSKTDTPADLSAPSEDTGEAQAPNDGDLEASPPGPTVSQAAMEEALRAAADEEQVERRPEGDEPEEDRHVPTAGAGEGIVRALSELKEARQELEHVQARAKGTEERLLRLGAEFENYKKRVGRERDDDRKYANERLLKELLPAVDNLERALAATETSTSDQLVSGVEMVLRQVLDIFKKFGATQFSALNEPFNPELHEAMQQIETDEVPPGTVVSEYMKGYLLNDRLLRPAMVVVARAPEAPSEAEDTDSLDQGKDEVEADDSPGLQRDEDGGGGADAFQPAFGKDDSGETGSGEGES